MNRDELFCLCILRDNIVRNIKKFEKLEQKECSAERYGQGIMRKLTRTVLAEDHHEYKAELRNEIFALQRQFLAKRAELEKEISCIDDQYTRLAFSLRYVDLLSVRDAASTIGGSCTAAAIQAKKDRFLGTHNTPERSDSS